MKNLRKIRALLLTVLMLCCMALSACSGGTGQSTEADYQVTVADALGNPSSGVIVCFLKDGEQVAMVPVNENGVASKTMGKGNYTVELMFTGNAENYHYEKENFTLTADKTQLNVVLSKTVGSETKSLYASGKDQIAYYVQEGCTYLELSSADRSYFIFTPQKAGTYEFAVIGTDAAIGYYGAPHFVQDLNAAEVTENNTFTVSVSASMIGTGDTGTTALVIGIDPSETDGILTIERIGDPERSVSDEPWTVYKTTAELAPYTLADGAVLQEFDLTADYDLVLNETDGFYHLDTADGPLVLVRLGKESKYLDCFQKILDASSVVKYFYDENNNFVKKESYSECLLEYIGYMDADNGVYPLTEDLKYIIQQRGDYSGWFDPKSDLYVFVDSDGNLLPGINADISWLFMCCYVAS